MRRTAPSRAAGSWLIVRSQVASWSSRYSGMSPAVSVVSGTVNTGISAPACGRWLSSISPKAWATSTADSAGTRLSTTATLSRRRQASCSSCHCTASAYRSAVVTSSQLSAAPSSRRPVSRLPWATELMSGASISARP